MDFAREPNRRDLGTFKRLSGQPVYDDAADSANRFVGLYLVIRENERCRAGTDAEDRYRNAYL